jgi:transcriptional regulator with XRE-family HTH domain
MLFRDLLEALRENVRRRIRNGELTERGLARIAGISQPHLHHLLKGARVLTAEKADMLLSCLKLSVLDLIPDDQVGAALSRSTSGPPSAEPPRKGASRAESIEDFQRPPASGRIAS